MENNKWHEDAKRLGGERLIPVITKIQENHEDLDKKFKKAFPAGDHEGHCSYHKTMIEMLEERRKLRAAVQEKTISGLVWLLITSIGLAVWHEILSIFKGN